MREGGLGRIGGDFIFILQRRRLYREDLLICVTVTVAYIEQKIYPLRQGQIHVIVPSMH